METPLSRRAVLGAVSIGALGLAGCLGGDDSYHLDPDDFADEYLHLVAEGLVRADLEIESIGRVDGWIEASVFSPLALDDYHGPDRPEWLETPLEGDMLRYAVVPGYEPVVEWYLEAVGAGEQGEGIRVSFTDGRCRGRTEVSRQQAEWVLNETLDRDVLLVEFSRANYAVDCPVE